MTIDKNDIKALHVDMARVLDETEYVIHHFLKGQRKATHLVEQDVRHLRDQLNRLAKHLKQLQQLHPDSNRFDDDPDVAYGIEPTMEPQFGDATPNVRAR